MTPFARPLRYLALLAASLTLAGWPAQAQDSSDDSQTNTNAPAEIVAVDDIADDVAIQERLIKIYDAAENAGWLSDCEVVLDSGIVTLKGVADTEEQRQWAANVARKTQDVVAVINELKLDDTVDLESTKQIVADSLNSLCTDLLKRSPLLIAALLVLIITAFLAKIGTWLAYGLLDQRGIRTSLKDLVYQFVSILIWILGLLVATVVAFPGMTPSKALTVLGLGSVAIGFAFKDIFENFFAGILILWRYPFDRGDFIACEGLTGKVETITIRNTMIRKLDGELAVVPNGTLFKNNVDVLTSQPQRRVRLICGVAYDEDIDQCRDVIVKAVQSCESVQGKRTVEVFAHEFASSSINFEVAWWTGSKPIDIRRSRDEVVASIKRSLDKAGIEIPFPYRTLTFKDASVADSLANSLNSSQPNVNQTSEVTGHE